MRTIVPLAFAASCAGSGSTPTDAAFAEELTLGYTCGPGSYVAFDPDRTLRLQVFYGDPTAEPPPADVTFDLPADGADWILQLYFGACLSTPGCTDDPNSRGCDQEIDSVFDAVSGTVHLTEAADLSVSGTATDLVLEGRDGEDPLEIPALELPPVPRWVGYTY
jgi:hypothetical protein